MWLISVNMSFLLPSQCNCDNFLASRIEGHTSLVEHGIIHLPLPEQTCVNSVVE